MRELRLINDFKTYYELTKPGIIYGNLLTLVAGFLLASKGNFQLPLFISTIIGAYLIIASACVFNNVIDAKIDKKMKRTSGRALVSGKIAKKNALFFASLLGLIGFFALILFTNIYVVISGLVAFLFYIFPYSYFKRTSWIGTMVGTVPGALPLVAGYTAARGYIDLGAILLFLIMIFWQIPHFYALGIFRMKDYKSAKLPILPVSKGIKETKIHMFIFTFLYLISIFVFSVSGYTGIIFLIIMNILSFYWLSKVIRGFKIIDDVLWSKDIFKYSLILLSAFSLFLSLEVVLP